MRWRKGWLTRSTKSGRRTRLSSMVSGAFLCVMLVGVTTKGMRQDSCFCIISTDPASKNATLIFLRWCFSRRSCHHPRTGVAQPHSPMATGEPPRQILACVYTMAPASHRGLHQGSVNSEFKQHPLCVHRLAKSCLARVKLDTV